MSRWAAKRQLLVIGTFVAIVLVFVVLFAARLLSNPPTCTDGKQNGEETGVDVGGNCPIANPSETRQIVVEWERAFLIADDVYSAAAYFENQNFDVGIPEVPYRFRLYDDENVLIAERIGTTFIGPNQRSVIVETALKTGNREPQNVFFEFLREPVWYFTDRKYSTQDIVVQEQEMRNVTTAPQLRVTLRNRAEERRQNIDVVAVLYGANGNALSVSQTFIPSMRQNATEEIVFTWPNPFEEPIFRIDVIPRINIFDQQRR